MKAHREGRGEWARLAAAAALGAALSCSAGRAAAQAGSAGGPAEAGGGAPPRPGRVALTYRIDEGVTGCEDEATFRAWVAARNAGRDPFVLDGPPAHRLDVHLVREPPGVRGVAELRDAKGALVLRREALERQCVDAIDRMVLAVWLSVFPPPAAPLPAAPPPAAAREGVAALAVTLSAGALVTVHLTRDVGPGVWLGADARSGPGSIGFELRALLPAPVSVGPHDFDLSQVSVLLTPCGRLGPLFACATVGAGAEIRHDANGGVGAPVPGSVALVSLGGRAGIEVPFGAGLLAARAWGEVLYSTHSVVEYTPTGSLWTRPEVSAFFGAGLVVHLGIPSTRGGAAAGP